MHGLNLHNFSTFFILVYAVEKGALILKQSVYQHYNNVELRCERAFSESYMTVSFVDVTKFDCE